MRILLPILIGLPVIANVTAPPPQPTTFAQCSGCHKVAKGEPNSIGPNLNGIGGRKAGQVPNFVYSPAMKKSGITWTRKELIAFISNPQARVPGSRMFYAQPDKAEAARIADYLMGLR